MANFLLVMSNGAYCPVAGSTPIARAIAGYASSHGWMPDAGCRFSVVFNPMSFRLLRNCSGSGNSSLFQLYPLQPLEWPEASSSLFHQVCELKTLCQSMSITKPSSGTSLLRKPLARSISSWSEYAQYRDHHAPNANRGGSGIFPAMIVKSCSAAL